MCDLTRTTKPELEQLDLDCLCEDLNIIITTPKKKHLLFCARMANDELLYEKYDYEFETKATLLAALYSENGLTEMACLSLSRSEFLTEFKNTKIIELVNGVLYLMKSV